MSGPYLEIDVGAIERNARSIVGLCASHGIEVMGVTKGVFGNPEVAAAMLRGGVHTIGDSRIDSLARLRAGGIRSSLALLRAPSLSQTDAVLDVVDVGLHTELVALERLGAAARAAGRVHEVIAMVDLGDRREGVLPEALPGFAREAIGITGIRLAGIGTNLTCLTGMAPNAATMRRLVDLAEHVERELGLRFDRISAGGSSTLPLLAAGGMPARVNQLRIGEAILLGRETVHHRPWPGTVQGAVALRAEVVEVKDKPPPPPGPVGDRAFGRAPAPVCPGGRRALVALGRADVDVDGLTPLDAGHEILGATSDYLVIDVSRATRSVAVGDELSYAPDYGALVTAAGSIGVETRVLDERGSGVTARTDESPAGSR